MLEINILTFFITMLVAWILFRLIVNVKAKKVNIAREVIMQFFFVYVSCLIAVTFFEFRVFFTSWHFSANLSPFTETIAMLKGARLGTSLINILGNLILLAPFGFFLPTLNKAFRKFYKILLAVFFVSLSIELLQYMLMVRLFDVDDLIFNTIGVVFGYLVYLILSKIKLFKMIQTRTENKKNQSSILAIVLPVIVISLIFGGFWFLEYFKVTYPIDKNAENSVYQFVVGDEIKMYSGDRYYIVLSENTEDTSTKNVSIFVKTPFQRAVPYITSTIKAQNKYGNSYSFSSNSTIDKNMFYMLYGYNNTGKIVTINTVGKEYKQPIEKGYFITTFLTDGIGDLNISFSDKDGNDVTREFEMATD
jgi:glycopeptide antibiotics resistance protein